MPKGIYNAHNWEKPDIEEFKIFYLSHPIDETAKHFKTSTSSIIRFARKYNIHRSKIGQPQRRQKSWTEEQEKEVLKLYKEGFIATQIASKVNLKRHQVVGIINTLELDGYKVKKVSDLKGSSRIEYLENRRNNHLTKFGERKFSLSISQKQKISEARLKPGFREKYHEKYSEGQKKLISSGHRPFGNSYALKQSKTNLRWKEFFESNGLEVSQEFCCGGKFYDLKINNFLIEINPTYTHNSTRGAFNFNGSRRDPLSSNYHLYKTLIAEENGYRCVHVWDWDSPNRILDILKKKIPIYARDCEVNEVSQEETDRFLNDYHIQGTCKNQEIRLGLFKNAELMQIMTFGKARYSSKYEYELLRLCTSSGKIIIGGAQKLFNYFLKTRKPTSIVSYCDRSKFAGDIYKILGFQVDGALKPDLKWVKGSKIINDSMLIKFGADNLIGTSYGKGSSNSEILEKEGFVKVYGVGQQKWVWRKSV